MVVGYFKPGESYPDLEWLDGNTYCIEEKSRLGIVRRPRSIALSVKRSLQQGSTYVASASNSKEAAIPTSLVKWLNFTHDFASVYE